MVKERRSRAFNVLFDATEYGRLEWLAERKGYSKGMVVRELVRVAYGMEKGLMARCATGERCLVPAVWETRQHSQEGG